MQPRSKVIRKYFKLEKVCNILKVIYLLYMFYFLFSFNYNLKLYNYLFIIIKIARQINEYSSRFTSNISKKKTEFIYQTFL